MNLRNVAACSLAAACATPVFAQQATGTPGGFGAMDRNQDGYISRDEARDAPWSNRFSEFDKDNDGRLSPGEYDALRQDSAAGAGTYSDPRSSGGTQSGSSSPAAGDKTGKKKQ
jgi:hypothetical protein